MRRHYTWYDAEPHGTRELTRYLFEDVPDTRRLYGRRMVRGRAARCYRCGIVDRRFARIRRMHAAYGRKSR